MFRLHRPTLLMMAAGLASILGIFASSSVLAAGTATVPTGSNTPPGAAALLTACGSASLSATLATACAAHFPTAAVLHLDTGLAVSGSWQTLTASAGGDPCASDGTWLFTGQEYYTLQGSRCWNGSEVWNYVGQVGCTAVPIPAFVNYCVSQASGALAPAWYSGLWANFSAVAVLIPECYMPRIYDWGNGSWNSQWYSHLGFC